MPMLFFSLQKKIQKIFLSWGEGLNYKEFYKTNLLWLVHLENIWSGLLSKSWKEIYSIKLSEAPLCARHSDLMTMQERFINRWSILIIPDDVFWLIFVNCLKSCLVNKYSAASSITLTPLTAEQIFCLMLIPSEQSKTETTRH